MPDWEVLYQTGDTGWDRGQVSPALQTWLNQGVIQEGAKVLIPGCGRGHEVVVLAKLGFDVTAIDLAPSAIEALNQTLEDAGVSATTVCADIFSYQTAQQFDVVYEQTCLCAIEPKQRSDYERCLEKWLKAGGKLLFSMMQTGEVGGPPYHCELTEMRTLFGAKDWQWENEPPFVVARGHQSQRFELGFMVAKVGF